jgi:hypothetical protein
MVETDGIITFNYKNSEYVLDMKIIRNTNSTPDSDNDQLFIQVSVLFDILQWKLVTTEDELIKTNKYWRICFGVESIYYFIKEKISKNEFEISFPENGLTFSFDYQNSFQKAKLTLTLRENKSDIESCVSSQASSIKSLCDKIKNLEKKNENLEKEIMDKSQTQIANLVDKFENTLKSLEEKIQSNKESYEKKIEELIKMVPSKPNMITIFDCGYEAGSPSYYNSSWTNFDKAVGKLELKNKSNIFWDCYLSSLYANNTYQVSLRIEVRNTNTGNVIYWPNNKVGGYVRTYVPNTYFPLIKFSDCNVLESGNYSFQLQIMYSSNSSSYPFYFYGGGNGGEVKMTSIYFDI